ncbi:hypothetical protein LXA43DRAFT_1067284 [Ganoderma leucocontextum]|nr:hypothetical protein LXA43DRAFT_1067284 [Ganoderma leucocontextum]
MATSSAYQDAGGEANSGKSSTSSSADDHSTRSQMAQAVSKVEAVRAAPLTADEAAGWAHPMAIDVARNSSRGAIYIYSLCTATKVPNALVQTNYHYDDCRAMGFTAAVGERDTLLLTSVRVGVMLALNAQLNLDIPLSRLSDAVDAHSTSHNANRSNK